MLHRGLGVPSRETPASPRLHWVMTGRMDTGWRLAALALAWLGGVALHLQQRSLPTGR
jgi:hypothetical protein